MVRRRVRALVLLTALALLAGPHAERTFAQAATPLAAAACDRLHTSLSFPLGADGPQQPEAAVQAFDMSRPDIALTCQVVLVLPSGDSFADSVDPGTVVITLDGPAQIVETGTPSLTLSCGDPSAAGSCQGATDDSTAAAPAVLGTDTLTFHLALSPGTPLPPGGLPAAVTVHAVYTSAIDASEVEASAPVDVVAPTYNESVSASALTIGSSALDSTLITAELHATEPTGCGPLPGSAYLVCEQDGPPAVLEAGVEPGVVSFVTTLGRFPNGEQRFDALCGMPAQTPPGVVVPAPGGAVPLPASCTGVSVRLTPGGQAGDAVVSVRFAGAITAAFAVGATHITIAPEPELLTLHGGCNQVQAPRSLPNGSPVSLVVQLVDPSRAVLGVWRRDPQTGAWQAGYLRDTQAPLQFDQVDPGDPLWICLDAAARFPLA